MNHIDVSKMNSDELKKFSFHLKTEIAKKFYGVDHVVDTLLMGYWSSFRRPRISNVILFGRGGYGKSEIVKLFFELINADAKAFDFSKDSTVESMLGGQNLAVWQEDGDIFYNLHNSSFAHQFVRWEEALSAPSSVLTAFRNPLTDGKYVQNQQVFQVKTQFIVICTNRLPDDFKGDEDMEAFLQRFPYQRTVDWSHLDAYQLTEAYNFVVNKAGGASFTDTDIIVETAIEQQLSPRQVITVVESLSFLKILDGDNDASTAFEAMNIVASNIEAIKTERMSKILQSEIVEAGKIAQQVNMNIINLWSRDRSKVNIPMLQTSKMLIETARASLNKKVSEVRVVLPDAMITAADALRTLSESEKQMAMIAGEMFIGGVT